MGNNTKIKYLNVEGKIYEITRISFFYMIIEASETDLTIDDVSEDEVWEIEEFKNYGIKLVNNGGMGEILEFSDWVNRRK